MDELSLTDRQGLPDALRVLLQAYPRTEWDTHPNCGLLTRFWLDRHLMFRRLSELLRSDTQARIDRALEAQDHLHRLNRFGGMLVGELHGHHQIEDHHYFPRLGRLEPVLERGFALLDADHHVLDERLASFTRSANDVLSGGEPGPFLDALDAFDALLVRHLEDEEDLIVPVLLKHGEAAVE
jgi:hemerythrin-like domain-containing protein